MSSRVHYRMKLKSTPTRTLIVPYSIHHVDNNQSISCGLHLCAIAIGNGPLLMKLWSRPLPSPPRIVESNPPVNRTITRGGTVWTHSSSAYTWHLSLLSSGCRHFRRGGAFLEEPFSHCLLENGRLLKYILNSSYECR